MRRIKWSKAEIAFLQENYQRLGAGEVSRRLGRSLRSVQTKASRMNLHVGSHRRWKEDEDEYVYQSYPATDLEEMACHLHRTEAAIQSRAAFLGVRREIEPWNKGRIGVYTEETLSRMRKARMVCIDVERAAALYQSGLSLKAVADKVGVSFSVIRRRLGPLGIVRGKSEVARGRKLSPGARRRMSEAQKRWHAEHPLARVGEKNSFYGKTHPAETIERMKRKLSVLMSGENNPQWRGGISYAPYARGFTRQLKEKVRKRDGYKCFLCGTEQKSLGYSLCVHHINYDKNDHSLENLISLCDKCHGCTGHNREYWQECLERIVIRDDS